MKESGVGRENGVEAFEACQCSFLYRPWQSNAKFSLTDTQSKSTIINIASAEETRTVQDWFAEEEETEEAAEPKRYG